MLFDPRARAPARSAVWRESGAGLGQGVRRGLAGRAVCAVCVCARVRARVCARGGEVFMTSLGRFTSCKKRHSGKKNCDAVCTPSAPCLLPLARGQGSLARSPIPIIRLAGCAS